MARYVLIENNSGFIYGDTADLIGFDGSNTNESEAAVEAARLIDESIGVDGLAYTFSRRDPRTSETYYRVYRVDVNGSEVVPVVTDGQDNDMIDAVVRDGEFVGVVRREGGEG